MFGGLNECDAAAGLGDRDTPRAHDAGGRDTLRPRDRPSLLTLDMLATETPAADLA